MDQKTLDHNLARQVSLVQSLRMALYTRPNPADSCDLLALATEEKKLNSLEKQMMIRTPARQPGKRSHPAGKLLAPDTTGLQVECQFLMEPLPTAIYHLLDPLAHPLLRVRVENHTSDTRRVCVKTRIEGLSAEAVQTVELGRGSQTLHFSPTLLPTAHRSITDVQRATVHVVSTDLDGKLERHETFPITCLARTSSFNSVQDPETGQRIDLSRYYAAWVTPYAKEVQERVRRAADLWPGRQMFGYQDTPETVQQQVEALYKSVQEVGIAYVHSVIDYGGTPAMDTQRTRLPAESLAQKSANCIDGAVLMASLLEGASLSPAIVLIPGHAFLGWETWEFSGHWAFLETTMLGTADFGDAHQSGSSTERTYREVAPDQLTVHSIRQLRAEGIWPMA